MMVVLKTEVKMKDKLFNLRKSITLWLAALLLAAPDLMAFLPTVKDSIPAEMYSWVYKGTIFLFILARIKTQLQK